MLLGGRKTHRKAPTGALLERARYKIPRHSGQLALYGRCRISKRKSVDRVEAMRTM